MRPEAEHGYNSPWNIAADFRVDMSFDQTEIQTMLEEYELDFHTGMNTEEIAGLLYDYTSGYPYLVSKLCQILDEQVVGFEQYPNRAEAWTREGFLEAVKRLLKESNTLFSGYYVIMPNGDSMLNAATPLSCGGSLCYDSTVEFTNQFAIGWFNQHLVFTK